ncbi:hypothetical protein B0H11DRAFT_2244316 [Mycena galericulata]|nr:hypothetical protein B0H11DRAFT_2244316 [Mycena galericulata]
MSAAPVLTGEKDDDSPPRSKGYYLQMSPVYEERADCGMYDELANTLSSMGVKALGNVDCPDDFQRFQPPHSSNVEYKDSDGFEFRTLIVGEIASGVHGSVLRATGNYYTSGDFKPIDDNKSNVKDILALTMPTCATTRLANFYENQTVPLRAAIDHEIGIEAAATPLQEYMLRPWLRAIEDGSTQDDLIMCHMLPKYGVPASAGTTVAIPARRGKRKLDDDTPRSSNVAAAVASQESAAFVAPIGAKVPIPDPSEIKLGAYYDPRLLEDYGGAYFNHVKSKLVQLDVRDGTEGGNNALVPPWEFYARLKLGTLVLINASLHIFIMNDTDSKRARKRKVYQINAHSIKILADSDAPVEPRSIMVPRNFEGASHVAAPPEFNNFSLKSSPTKGKEKEVQSVSTSGSVAASSNKPAPGDDEDVDMITGEPKSSKKHKKKGTT